MLIDLAKYEIEALMMWHRDRQWEAANKEDYTTAEQHKLRADELRKVLGE